MTSHPSHPPVSALRERMIEDMTVRGFGAKTRHDYVRHVRTFAAFLGRSPDTATAEEVRRFQLHQTETGVGAPSVNSAVSALRFLFSVTDLRHHDPEKISFFRRMSRDRTIRFDTGNFMRSLALLDQVLTKPSTPRFPPT